MARLYTLSKNERLSSKKLIDKIFKREGEMISKFPLSFIFLKHELKESIPVQVMFSVPSKKVKKAHDRNYIKRLMRESYRHHKPEFYSNILNAGSSQYICCLMYNSDLIPKYDSLHQNLKVIFHEFAARIS